MVEMAEKGPLTVSVERVESAEVEPCRLLGSAVA